MTDNDPLHNVQAYALSLGDRLNDLLARVEALRLLLVPLGISAAQFDAVFREVSAEIAAYHQQKHAAAVASALDARIRQLLDGFEGPRQ